MAERDRVFVDANELFPFTVMDLLLSLAEDLLIDFVWTDELLDEWERVIVREGQRTAETATSVSRAVRRFFASGRIAPDAYRRHIEEVPGPDPDDRAHTAACAFGEATILLTRNSGDFPIDFLATHGVAVATADDFLSALLRRRPSAFVDSFARLVSRRRHPPVSLCDFVASLEKAGTPKLAGGLRRRLGCPEAAL